MGVRRKRWWAMNSFEDALDSAGRRTEKVLRNHPKQLYAAVVVLLLGFGATAFGIAPLAPDASDLPKRIVSEAVVPLDIESQLEALAAHELELSRADLTRGNDTADSLLRRLNVIDGEAANFLRQDPTARRLFVGRAGKMIQVQTDEAGRLLSLVARFPSASDDRLLTHFSRLTIERDGHLLQARLEEAALESRVKMGSGEILHSLFAATDEAHIPDVIATQMAEVFSSEINFQRELRRGDRFSVIYEALTADGEPITWNQGAGRVLGAEFVNKGRSYTAVWFKDANGRGGYFDINGQSKRRTYLASPLQYSRITSGFAMRFHPILRTWRAHDGIDLGAPTGTPVRTVGDGTVEFAGWQNGYGNVVHVRHNKDQVTVYAHLSKIQVRRGQRVAQGDNIGLVGATGWATGPHLHFEFKVGGRQVNPMVLAKMGETVALSGSARAQFAVASQDIRGSLQQAQGLGGGTLVE
jgi:murein DD-endopeptidase MepM/ murein hydrolase activator NlpD